MKKTARVIITFDCDRDCSYCANKYKNIIEGAIRINEIERLANYDEIIITGGEPLLEPNKTLKIIENISWVLPSMDVYLYTAKYDVKIWEIMDYLKGINYTLHMDSSERDILDFYAFQDSARVWIDDSFRLYIFRGILWSLKIEPNIWNQIRIIDWLPEEECVLPEHETLFIYEE